MTEAIVLAYFFVWMLVLFAGIYRAVECRAWGTLLFGVLVYPAFGALAYMMAGALGWLA